MPESEIIPWKRISVEAIAIVGSILLAFAIDAWWAESQEREFERETLAGLLEEFQDHKVDMSRDGHVFILGAVNELIQAANTGSYESSRLTIDQLLFFLRIPLSLDLGSGVRDALISSGQIEVIADKALRYEIAEWSGVFDELRDDEEAGRKFVFDLVIPYLVSNGVPAPRFTGFESGTPVMQPGYRALADNPVQIKNLLDDPEFLSILEVRASFLEHTIEENDELIAATDSIISKIEAALRE